MVDCLLEDGWITTAGVASAFRTVPRHLFAPDVPVERAYAAGREIAVKCGRSGLVTSSLSAPWLQARMLEYADLAPGMRVLEVGSGGYNAALLAELVGVEGLVVTVDIDRDVTDRAEKLLAEAGYGRVQVRCADAGRAMPDLVPGGGFDAIVVTAQCGDIAPVWLAQLAPGGRLVLPLTFRGRRRVIGFDYDGSRLRSRGHTIGAFPPLLGLHRSSSSIWVDLDGADLRLTLDEDQPVDPCGLARAVVPAARATCATGIELPPKAPRALFSLDLWLAVAVCPSGWVTASQRAVAAGLADSTMPAAATWDADAIAFTTMGCHGEEAATVGVIGYGAMADALVELLTNRVRVWDILHRHGGPPVINAYPASAPDDTLPAGQVIDKLHSRLVLCWHQLDPEPA